MARFAIVKNGLIHGWVLWDGESDWTPPAGFTALSEAAAAGLPTYSPPVEPEADWPTFRSSILVSPAYGRIAAAANVAAPHLLITLHDLFWRLHNEPDRLAEVAAIWNAIAAIAQPTEAEVAELNAIGASSSVPFSLSASGLIVV